MTTIRKTLGAVVLLLVVVLAIAWWIVRSRDGADALATVPPRGGTLIASMRSDARSYDRYVDSQAATDLVTLLTQAPLVRVNRATDELEPWLAERWRASPDGRTYTLTLRPMTFSDGAPFTSADVLFAFEAVYDDRVKSALRSALEVEGQPLQVSAPG